MAAGPEDVAAPAADVTVFRTSRRQMFTSLFVGFSIMWPIADAGMSRLLGDADADPWWGVLLQAVCTGALFAALMTYVAPVQRPTWVRTSSGGLEVSAPGSDPIHIAWTDITHVEVRRTGLRWTLEVTPVDPGRVNQVHDGNSMPRMRDGVITVDLSWTAPGPRSLRREVNRWSS